MTGLCQLPPDTLPETLPNKFIVTISFSLSYTVIKGLSISREIYLKSSSFETEIEKSNLEFANIMIKFKTLII